MNKSALLPDRPMSIALPTNKSPSADCSLRRFPQIPLFLALPVLLGVFVGAYAATLADIVKRWSTDTQYSHGYFVPPLAVAILWSRRTQWAAVRLQPSWWGMPMLALAALIHLAGAFFYFTWLDAISMLPCLGGLVILLLGWSGWAWAWPALLYLSFLLPLPYQLQVGLAYPLQRLATLCSTYLLQCLGVPALAQGNIIHVNDWQMGVVEACSGLGMLVTFFALSAAFALLVPMPAIDKIVIFLSAIPIGVMANVLRITATGLCYWLAGGPIAKPFVHDLAGWLMMPFAIGMLWLELCSLNRLFVQRRHRLIDALN